MDKGKGNGEREVKKINHEDNGIKCTLCNHNIFEIDGRHVYNGICFQCIFDILYFLENYYPSEFYDATKYAHKKSRGKA